LIFEKSIYERAKLQAVHLLTSFKMAV
jgi:hypothetical protein